MKADHSQQMEGQKSCFFIVAAQAIFTDEHSTSSRTLNVLLETPHPNLTKAYLGDIQKAVMQRLNAENKITPDQLRDVIVLNISLMGVMSPDQFHGVEEPQSQPLPN